MSRSRSVLWCSTQILGLALVIAQPAFTQTINQNAWVTNGDVKAIATYGGTTYVGGSFSQVGPATGSAVPIDPNTATLPAAFPKVAGEVYSIVTSGTGWYLGGSFTSVGGQPRNNIAFVNLDLTVSSWNPGANAAVHALLVPLFSTTLYVGGSFSQIGSVGRNRVAAFDITSGAVNSWNPSGQGTVRALAAWGTQIFIGGSFTSMSGFLRQNLASVHSETGVLTSFIAPANGTVHALTTANRFIPDVGFFASLYVGGSFTDFDGQPRNRIAEVDMNGVVTSWNPNANGTVHAIATQGDVFVGGEFTTIGGQPRNRFACIQPGTPVLTSLDPNANGTVLAISANAGVYVGGEFTQIGGQPRNHIAQLGGLGTVTSWNPNLNGVVRGIHAGTLVYAVGSFNSAGVQHTRHNLAAFDATTGLPKGWNPDANGTVNALALAFSGEQINSVFAGGAFTTIGGQTRNYIAAIEPDYGNLLPANPNADGEVFCLAVAGSKLHAGGTFETIGGAARYHLAEIDVGSGIATELVRQTYFGVPVNAIAVSGSRVYFGGQGFLDAYLGSTQKWQILPLDGQDIGTITCLAASGGRIFAGGNFTEFAFEGMRNCLAEIMDSQNDFQLSPWNPSPNGLVRCLAVDNSTVYAGGDFTSIGGQPRSRFAALDRTTGLATTSTMDADASVRAVAVDDWALFAGGSFSSIAGQPQGHLALFESPHTYPSCLSSDLTSSAGPVPRAVTSGDFDNDSIQDLVVCNDWVVLGVSVLRGGGSSGVGNGLFSATQNLPLDARPMQAVVADFDLDGRQDVAISKSATIGSVALYLNNAGTLQHTITIPLPGRSDGLACADMDLDGILDFVVCLTDSAGNSTRGGAQVVLGGGQGGIWDGTFALGPKFTYPAPQRVVLADFNQDGIPELALSGKTASTRILRFSAPLTNACNESGGGIASGLATGDFNEDGRLDLVATGLGEVVVRLKTTATGAACASGFWFDTEFYPSPSMSRDIAVLDFTQDGILDLVTTHDDVGTVQLYTGRGTSGVGDGTFDAPITLLDSSAWGLVTGDFVGNGSPDVAFTKHECDTAEVIPQTASPSLPTNLTLLSPNGGEVWPQATTPPGDLPQLASLQSITWSKGAGVHGVDVEVSRDQGASWQTIARNHPGTSMNWTVTAPGSPYARVRVRDHAVPSRSDASDANFEIPATATTDIAPDETLPRVAAFACVDRNPVRGAVRFRMELPAAADADVQIFDVAGRRVQTLARTHFAAGRHTLTWDGRDARGARAAHGVYFVRARCGEFEAKHKIVVLKSGS